MGGPPRPPVVIENPILNSPYREPTRHFRFDANDQITSSIDTGRRGSSYFLPIAAPKKKATPGLFDDDVTETKAESGHVNRIRQLVKQWRDGGWPDVTHATRALLDHWHAEDRFRRLFFCQIEALETLVFITEVAKQTGYGQTGSRSIFRKRRRKPALSCSASRARWRPGAGRPSSCPC